MKNKSKTQNEFKKRSNNTFETNIYSKDLLKKIESLFQSDIINENEFWVLKKRIDDSNKILHHKTQDNKEDEKVVLKVINLTKIYPKKKTPAIDNLNFELKQNQFHVFIGANGAGKTTTIKAIVSAYSKYDGQILINDQPNNKTVAKINIGYIPEKSIFPKDINTKTYLISMAMMSGVKRLDAIKFANNKLKEFNMEKLAYKNPNNFSSGQQKKILLAQALVHNPSILIMDEPAANLDPVSRVEFYQLAKKLQHEGKSIFLSSHILAEINKYADYVTILDGGKIVYSGKINKNDDLEKLYFTYIKLGSVDTGLINSSTTIE